MWSRATLFDELVPQFLWKGQVRELVAVQVAQFDFPEAEFNAFEAMRSLRHTGPAQDLMLDQTSGTFHQTSSIHSSPFVPRLKVQLNLKSSPGMVWDGGMNELLTIGEVARRSGVASSALRFYEQRELIQSQRAGSGHRRFPRSVLRRIAFIVFAQRIGLSLDEIGDELAKLPPERVPTRTDWSHLSSKWASRIDRRIEELERLKRGLTECIGCGCLSLDRCKLSNPGDRAAGFGPGPRYWIGDRPADR